MGNPGGVCEDGEGGRCIRVAILSTHAMAARRGWEGTRWSNVSIFVKEAFAGSGSVRNVSERTIIPSEPGMAMREASIQDMLRILGEVDYRKNVWNCPFCHVGTVSRRELKKHLRKGICKATVDARLRGHSMAFFRYCTCKGEMLWPQPAWYRGKNK